VADRQGNLAEREGESMWLLKPRHNNNIKKKKERKKRKKEKKKEKEKKEKKEKEKRKTRRKTIMITGRQLAICI